MGVPRMTSDRSPSSPNAEVYAQTGLALPPSKEKADENKKRMEANLLKLAVWVLRHQRALEGLHEDVSANFKEVLHRLGDMQGLPSDGSGLDDVVLENRSAIEDLTNTVNDLQDLESEFHSFRREARTDIASLKTKDHVMQAGTRRRADASPEREQGTSSKRARNDGREKERNSDRHDRTQNDVLLWPVDATKATEAGGAKAIAHKALGHVRLSTAVIIRFKDFASADSFVQSVRNEQDGLERLNAKLASSVNRGKGKEKAAARQDGGKHTCFSVEYTRSSRAQTHS
ncbi:hypothetical protein B0H13DRAFT_1896583 [Mycena leptocephala]|nr:hypothetical protein B0H13DRAFT_1896583 [Mycena leptocephala]